MQNAELYRRGIVLPLDDDAEKRLRANDVTQNTSIWLQEIPSQQLFETLCQLGLFQNINKRCSTLINDYEEEMVETSLVKEILAAVESVALDAEAQQPDIVEFLGSFRALVQEACRVSRPLLFVL